MKAGKRERAAFDRAYSDWAQKRRGELWEMTPLEMLAGRWGRGVDEDLVVLEEGQIHQTLAKQPVRFRIGDDTWLAIVAAHAGACLYCGNVAALEMDHIRAVARGGPTEITNLAPACKPCNRDKRAGSLSEWLGTRPDLDPAAIQERWDRSRRQGRLDLEGE